MAIRVPKRAMRWLGVLVLLGVTGGGIVLLFRGDWAAALGYWRGNMDRLGAALLLHLLNMALDFILWMWILRQFEIRVRPGTGIVVFLSGFAGLFLPLQLGRFLRSQILARLRAGPLPQAIKAELAFLFLSAVSAICVVAGLGAYRILPLAGPLAAAATLAVFLLAADRVARRLSTEWAQFPSGYWRRRDTIAIAALVMIGWLINGTVLYVIVAGVPGGIGILEAWVTAPASMIVGIGTGVPGGIGVVEGFLGVTLRLLRVPSEHLALAVAAFRMVTFWLWLPVGWAAFSIINRQAAKAEARGR